MKQKINVNTMATVTLTADGCKVYNNYQIHHLPQHLRPVLQYAGDPITTELWNLMQIFGSELYNGGKQLFKLNEIEVNLPVE